MTHIQALQFELETSNRTVLIVYNEESYFDIVEFCGCLKMDLAAPRSVEEAQEIERRGQLKYGYYTNFIRLRIDLTIKIFLSKIINVEIF